MPPQNFPQNNRTLVQYASVWPIDDAGWTTIEGAWATKRTNGFCNDKGSASFTYPFGYIKPSYGTDVVLRSMPRYVAKYIRICEEDPDGALVSDDGTAFTPVWVGCAKSATISPDSNMMGMLYDVECAGPTDFIDQITPARHYAIPSTGDVPAEIGSSPTFNVFGNRKTGNRSATKWDFGNGYSAYIFDLSETGTFWTDADIVEYAIAIQQYASPGGPDYDVAGQTGVLARIQKLDTDGLSSLEIINKVLSPRNGVGFRPYYDYATRHIILDVMSLSSTDVISDSFTLSANDRQKTLDLSPATGVADSWSVAENQESTYDSINVVIDHDWYAVTFNLDDFEPDWDNADRTAYQLIADERPDDPALQQGRMAYVGRRFRLKSDWLGTAWNGFTFPTDRTRETSSLFGEEGFNGLLNSTGGGALASRHSFIFTKTLPMPDGYNWLTQDPATADLTRGCMPPVFLALDADSTDYLTLAEACGLTDIGATIDELTATVNFRGKDDVVQEILALIDSGGDIFFTLGVKLQMNTIVGWRRNAGSEPRDKKRIQTKLRTNLQRKFITSGTLLGLNDTVLQQMSAAKTVHDDLPLAKDVLASLIPWFSESEWTVSRSLTGTISDPDFEVGDMITETSFLLADGSTMDLPITGIVTSLTHSYEGEGKVSMTTKRLAVGVEAFS